MYDDSIRDRMDYLTEKLQMPADSSLDEIRKQLESLYASKAIEPMKYVELCGEIETIVRHPPRKLTLEVFPDDTINYVAQLLVSSVGMRTYTAATFDGVELVCGGGDTPDDIVRKYHEAKRRAS